MLKLVFFTNDARLKVRHAFPEDDFSKSCEWRGKLNFIVTPNQDFTMVWTSLLPDLDPEYAEALVDIVGARYPVSPHYKFLTDKCPELSFSWPTDEWVFFGGTFNPWHKGHQACLDLLPEEKVCFIMPDQNPHKELQETHPVSKVLELSNKTKLRTNQFIVPTFLLEKKKNPTVDWIERLKKNNPNQKFSLLMGFDSFSNLKTWDKPEVLIPMLSSLYVVSRLEDDETRKQSLDEVISFNSHIEVIFLGRHEYEKLSSSMLRKNV